MRVLRPVQDFIKAEAGAGLLLLAMIPLAILWVNGPYADSYDSLWSTEFGLQWGSHELELDLRHWVNDGLMAVFFYVVGLEIKRELVEGELGNPRKAITPVLAAVGGMLLPALLYVLVNVGGSGVSGWGIPMATDIAIVLGFLSLLGRRVPSSLKTFLLTLAIVDDIGAIAVIALFYSEHAIDFVALFASIGLLGAFGFCARIKHRHPAFLVVLALLVWYATLRSGIHATLAGVAIALLTPARPFQDSDYVDAEALSDVSNYEAVIETVDAAKQTVSSVEWMQHLFHPWSSYFVLPVFALANAGIAVNADTLRAALESPVAIGIVVGLFVGKPLGICLATFLALRIFGGQLPDGLRFVDIAAGSVLAAIGFTVALFIADSAFTDHALIDEAKAGVLAVSLLAGALGYAALRLVLRRPADLSAPQD